MFEFIREISAAFLKFCYTLRHYPSQAALLLTLFLGWQVYTHNGEIYPGVHIELVTSADSELLEMKETSALVTKAQLLVVAESDKIINDTISLLLDQTQGDRVTVEMVHNGTFTMAAQHLMHFSVTHEVNKSNVVPGKPLQNEPLSEWSDFLPDLLNNKCTIKSIKDIKDPVVKLRMQDYNIGSFAACPIFDSRGVFLGGVFVSYNMLSIDSKPTLQYMQLAAARIGAALSLRPPAN